MTRLLMPRPINKIRISIDALNLCLEHNVIPFDYFILTQNQIRKKYNNFFMSNEKTIEKSHQKGHYLTGDHNVPNRVMLENMFELCENNPTADVNEYKKILNDQSYDLITLEENEAINNAGLKSAGTKRIRDALCSEKIEIVDLWLTPKYVIDEFFKQSGLNKDNCLDPCACDGRWLQDKGLSIDILPMNKNVMRKDFLNLKKEDIPNNIKYIVGNIPFSLLDDFVLKALSLVDDCYFLVSGDTIFKHFPNNIEHIWIFSGLEGNQKDNRSRCEFDVPFLVKSALWCCIVHITKQQQEKWVIENNLSNNEKRDGYHIALGKNTFIKSDVEIDKNERISRINVKSDIIWKGGKKVIMDGEVVDLKNFSHLVN